MARKEMRKKISFIGKSPGKRIDSWKNKKIKNLSVVKFKSNKLYETGESIQRIKPSGKYLELNPAQVFILFDEIEKLHKEIDRLN